MKIWKIALISTPIAMVIIGLMALAGMGLGKKGKKVTTRPTDTTVAPGEKKYSVNVVNEIPGITISGIGDYKENETVTLTASGIKAGDFFTWSINDSVVEIGDTLTLTVKKTNIDVTVDLTRYDYLYYKTDKNIYFGSYPQTLISNEDVIKKLNEKSGGFDINTWTDYEYYISGKKESFMYYKDIDINEDGFNDYRGIYFTQYRPDSTMVGPSASFQDNWGYNTETIYWFSFDPIKWNIVAIEDNKALLWASLNIDSQDFYCNKTTEEIEHNGGVGYANNYELSDIRKWLNDNFYNTAFNDLQKTLIINTLVKNDIEQVYLGSNDIEAYRIKNESFSNYENIDKFVSNDTNDNVFLLSFRELFDYFDTDNDAGIPGSLLRANLTDYAKSQGALKDSNSRTVSLLRSFGNSADCANYIGENGGLFGSYNAPYRRSVAHTQTCIRPALWIDLSGTDYKKVTVTSSNDEAGFISANGEFGVLNNYAMTLKAIPNNGYTFVGWFVGEEAVSTNQIYTFDVKADIEIEAKWIVNQYVINVVNKSSYDFGYDHGGQYDYKSSVTLKFNQPEGYSVKLYNEKDELLELDNNTYTLTIPYYDLEYSVYFELIEYRIIYDIPYGVANPNPITHTVEDDEIILDNPTASSEYTFKNWYIDDEIVTKIPGHIAKDIYVYGDFEVHTYNVNVINNTNGLTITGEGSYDYNGLVKVAIENNDGSKAMAIEVETLDKNNKKVIRMFNREEYEFYMPNHDVTLTIMDIDNPNYYNGESPEETRNFAGDEILYFGTYPQALVKDRSIKANLLELVGKNPTETGATGWTDYGFYEQDEVKSYMWYKDIDLDSDEINDYRAVYFTEYRPGHLDWKFSQAEADPDRTFNKNEIYFFKYEPIAWKKSVKEGSNLYAALLCLDAQSYVTNTDPYHTDYEYSYLRSFLVNTFCDTAFNSAEKELLENSSSGDKVSIFEYDYYGPGFIDTVSDHLGGTEYLKSEVTDYALCLRPKSTGAGYDVEGRGTYYLKIASGDSAHARTIHDVKNDDLAGSSHKKTVLCIRPIIKLDVTNIYSVFMHVDDTDGGTVSGYGTYNKGDHVTLTATPKEGYAFIGWTDNRTGNTLSSNPTYEFDITKNYSVTAVFLKKYYITYEGMEGADNKGNPEYYTTQYKYVTLFQPSKEGYEFNNWSKDGEYFYHQFETSLEEDITIKANWLVKQFNINYSYVDIDGNAISDVTNPNPTTYTIESDDIIFKGVGEVTNPNYEFVKWLDEDGNEIEAIEHGSKGDRTITGVFNASKYEVEVHNLTNGLELSTEGGMFDYNSEVEISLVNDTEHVLYFETTITVNDEKVKKVGTSIKFNMIGEKVIVYVTQMANNSFKEVDTTERNIENDAYFGSYPQTLVKDENLKTTLTDLVGATPTKVDDIWNENDWIDYGFYANGTVQKYMWYKDVTYNGEKYRAVYFTNHRPSNIYDDFSSDMISNYDINTIYFFKFEPVKWMKCGTAFMDHIKYDVYTTYAVLDEYQLLNDKTVVYPYYGKYSDLRSFVIGNLFNLLFDNCNTDNLGICYSTSPYGQGLDIITIFHSGSTIKDYLEDTDYMKIPASDYSSCLRPLKNGDKYSTKYEGGGSYWVMGQTPEEYSGVIVLDNATTTFTNALEAYTIEGIRPVIYVKREIYTVTTTKNKEAGGTVTQTYSYYRDNNATVVAQASAGYKFIGWEKDGSIVSTDESYTFKVTGSVNLKALFGKEYQITYVDTKGAENLNPATYTELDSISLIDLPDVHGYKFVGWTLNDEPISTIENLEGNITLVAKWDKVKFTVTLTPEITDLVVSVVGTCEYQSTVTLEVTTPIIGYDIIFKLGDEVLGTNTGSFIIEDNTVITLVKSPINYDITYTLNGGTNGDNPATYTIETPTITLDDATRNGYTFGGWYTSELFDENTKVTEITIGSTGEINLFAKFTLIPYDITYPNCGDDIYNNNPTNYTVEDELILFPAYKDYYDFIGWTFEENSTDYIVDNIIPSGTIYGPIELYAHWKPTDYTIVYYLNGGKNNPLNPEKTNCESPELTLLDPSRLGYEFAGWYDANNEKVTKIPANYQGTYRIDARWTALEYTISYTNNTGLTVKTYQDTYVDNEYIRLTFEGLEAGYYVKTTINGTEYNSIYYNELSIHLIDSVLMVADESNVISFTLEKDEIEYQISYRYCDDATNSNPTTIKVSQFPYQLEDPTREGYVFICWKNYQNVVTEIDISCVTQFVNIYLDAVWGHNATYQYEDGSLIDPENNSNPTTFAEDDRTTLTPLQSDLIPYYEFDGWYINDEKVTEIAKNTTTDVIIVAKFTPVKFDVTIVNQTGLTYEELAITGDLSVPWNGEIILTSGYECAEGKSLKWTISGSSDYCEGNSCRFSMQTNDVTVTVTLVLPYNRSGDTIYFGYYPQTALKNTTDAALINTLNHEIGADLDSFDPEKDWSSYGYIDSSDRHAMYYYDYDKNDNKKLDDGDYRAVYITNSSDIQDSNYYFDEIVYWFKYEKVEWKVLAEADGKALIVSELLLDSQNYQYVGGGDPTDPFNHNGDVGYGNNYALSDIRIWLNNKFYKTFSELEKSIIEPTTVDNSQATTNDPNNKYACSNTNDNIFLLSYSEASNSSYFDGNASRVTTGTDYAKCQGLNCDTIRWLLRSPYGDSPNNTPNDASCIFSDGSFDYTSVRSCAVGIRPAMWITL